MSTIQAGKRGKNHSRTSNAKIPSNNQGDTLKESNSLLILGALVKSEAGMAAKKHKRKYCLTRGGV